MIKSKNGSFVQNRLFFILFITDAGEPYSKYDLIKSITFLIMTKLLNWNADGTVTTLWCDCFLSYCFKNEKIHRKPNN